MSNIDRRSLTHEEAGLLLQCGSFWPESMVDRSSFMKMLLHIRNVEAETDIQTDRCEQELTSSGACNASGVVDVKHFVAFCLQVGNEGAETVLNELFTIREGAERGTSSAASQGACKGIMRNPDRSLTLSELSTAVIGEQIPPPSLEDQAGTVVVADSK
eukprot:2080462-Amphidinium_carterae.1